MSLLKNSNFTFHLFVRSPEVVVFEGDVKALTSENEVGVFDVLPLHENFISVIQSFLKIHDVNGGVREIEIDKGILEVWQDTAEIYLGI